MNSEDSFGVITGLSMLLAFLAVNSLILFVISFESIFALVTAGSILISVLLTVNKLTSEKKMGEIPPEHQTSISFRDNLGLIGQYLFLNRKYILGSAIGLIIACLIITQSTIVVSSYQQFAFSDYIEGSDRSAINFSASKVSSGSIEDWEQFFSENYHDWFKDYNLRINSVSSYVKLKLEFMMGTKQTISRTLLDTYTLSTRQFTPYYYELLSQFPTFPNIDFDEIESLLVIPQVMTFQAPEFGILEKDPLDYMLKHDNMYFFDILVDEEFKLQGEEPLDSPFHNITYGVSHVWTYSKSDLVYITEQQLNFPTELLFGNLFLTEGEEDTLLENLFDKSFEVGERDFVWGDMGLEGFVNVHLPVLGESGVQDFSNQLTEVVDEVYNVISAFFSTLSPQQSGEFISRLIYSPLEVLVDRYLRYADNFVGLMYVFSIPMILISLFLFYFAISIIEKQKRSIFQKLKIRGASRRQFQFMVLAEIGAYGIISPVIGLILGIGTSFFLLTYLNLFSASQSIIPVVIPASIFWRLPVLGILLAIDFNLLNIFRSTNITYAQFHEDSDEISTDSNYPLVLFGLATAYWLVIPYISVSGQAGVFVYNYVGFIMIGITVITLPILASRYIIPFFGKAIKVLPINLDTISLSVINIRSHKQYTNKLIALMLISMMFSFLGLVSSTTISSMNNRITNYNIGADMYVQGIRKSEFNSQWGKLSVNGVESVAAINQVVYNPLTTELVPGQQLEDAHRYNFLGIEPENFLNTGYWEEEFSEYPLSELMGRIKSNYSVALHPNIAQALGLSMGNDFEINYGYKAQSSLILHLNGSFFEFPRLIFSPQSQVEERNDIDYIHILANFETVEEIGKNANRRVHYGALVDLKKGGDPTAISHELYTQFVDDPDIVIYTTEQNRVSVFSVGGTSTQFSQTSPLARFEEDFIFSSLLTMLFVSFGISVLGIGYYAFIIISDRKREMGVYKSLGMVRKQILRLLLTEILIITICSLLISSIAGLFLSSRIFGVLSGTSFQTIPRFRLIIPNRNMGVFTLIMGLTSYVMAYLPSRYVANERTSNILRGE